MKKTLLGIILIPIFASSQVNVSTTPSNRVAILEEYTGNFCTYCPDGHLIASDDIEPTGAVTLKIQTGGFSGTDPVFGGSLQTSTGNTIAGPFDSQGYPNGSVNRTGAYSGIGRAEWVAAVNDIQSQSSPVNLYIESDIDVTTRELTVSVEYYYTGNPSSASNFLHIGYYQDNIPAYQYDPGFNESQFYMLNEGIYDFDHCFRDMINGTWGEELTSLSMGSTGIITHTITLPATFDVFEVEPGAIKIFAFMSETNQGEIITADKISPSYNNWPAVDDAKLFYSNTISEENCIGKPGSFSPTLLVGATGSNGLSTLDLTAEINGVQGNQSYSSLNLNQSEKKAISLTTPIQFNYQASNSLSASVSNPNSQVDPTADNDYNTTFDGGTTAVASKILLRVKTDSYADEESSFNVYDGSGNVVFNVGLGDLPNSATTDYPLELPYGIDCYQFELLDTYGDGWGYQTTSYFRIYEYWNDNLGTLIRTIDSDNELESSLTKAIEFDSNLDLENDMLIDVDVYPNPAQNEFHINFGSNNTDNIQIELKNSLGQLVNKIHLKGKNQADIDISSLESGVYFLNIGFGNKNITKKLTVTK